MPPKKSTPISAPVSGLNVQSKIVDQPSVREPKTRSKKKTPKVDDAPPQIILNLTKEEMDVTNKSKSALPPPDDILLNEEDDEDIIVDEEGDDDDDIDFTNPSSLSGLSSKTKKVSKKSKNVDGDGDGDGDDDLEDDDDKEKEDDKEEDDKEEDEEDFEDEEDEEDEDGNIRKKGKKGKGGKKDDSAQPIILGEDEDDEEPVLMDEDYIQRVHPEMIMPDTNELREIMKAYTRDVEPIIRKSRPILSKYEATTIIGMRAQQIIRGSTPFLDSKEVNPIDVAIQELRAKLIPIIIRRVMPDGISEYWRLTELTYYE
jgi:DNA-directed RNA polymerase subunit K/omega